jgi:hypothetical protein
MQPSITDISKKVFLKRPILEDILSKHGSETLLEYSAGFSGPNEAVPVERKTEFITALAGEVKRVLGEEVSSRVKEQLLNNYFVSTADHLGPLSHPFFLNSNMLAGLNGGLSEKIKLTDWVVLACSNISLNNSSYPRGVQFHTQKREGLELKSFSLFPGTIRHQPVYNLPGYTKDTARQLRNILRGLFYAQVPASDIREATEFFNSQDVLDLPSYSDQIMIINSRIFKIFFAPSFTPLNLTYINQEYLTVKLLENHWGLDTEIHRLMFDDDCRMSLLELFEGIPGAFSFKEDRGTFLFWGIDLNSKKRIRLMLKRNALVSADGLFSMPLKPEVISTALKNGVLIPSMLLNMLVVGGYYGVKCLGGFSQTSYLTWMLDAYKKIFPNSTVGDSKTLCGDFIFADIMANGNQAFAATGMDLLLYKKQLNPEAFVELCKTKTLSGVMDRVMPILFKILYPNEPNYFWPENAYKPDFSISQPFSNPIIKL